MSNSALIEDLERQFSENPRRVFARLANEYRKSGNLDGAIALCREHVPRHPGYISGHIVLGQALFESGAATEAKQAFEAALQLDPENLIALRYLGDISRVSGEGQEAIRWYRRLLEVDPQNEEVAAQIRLVEEGGLQPASPEATEAAPSSTGAADATAEAPLVSATEPAADAAPSASTSAAAESPATGPLGEAADEAAALSWSDIHPEQGRSTAEELAVVSEALSGADEPGGEAPLEANGAAEVDAPAEPAPEPSAMEWESEEELQAPEPTGARDAGSSGEPEVRYAAYPSHDAYEDGDTFAPGEIVPERDPFEEDDADAGRYEISIPGEDVVSLAGGEDDFDQPRGAASDDDSDAFGWPTERQSFDAEPSDRSDAEGALSAFAPYAPEEGDGMAGQEYSGMEVSAVEDIEEEPRTGEASEPAFVTETVAELYERQGHLQQSLEVYRQLAAQNPGNEAIRLHVERLEQELAAARGGVEHAVVDAVKVGPTESGNAPQSYDEPTESGNAAESYDEPAEISNAPQAYDEPAEISNAPQSYDEPAAIAPEAAEPPPRPRAEQARAVFRRVLERRLSPRHAAALPAETLFLGSSVPSAEDTAASVLAGAFSPDFSGGDQPGSGRPARAATDELSLDAIFGKPGGRSAQGNGEVSFDEFFPDASQSRDDAAATRPNEVAADDDEIFHSWLDGLKR